MTILDLLEDASHDKAHLTILSAQPERRSLAELWAASATVGSSIEPMVGARGVVAMVLTTTFEAIVSMVGAWRAGMTVASMPPRGRGTPAAEHRASIASLCTTVGAQLLIIDDDSSEEWADFPLPVRSFRSCLEGGPGRSAEAVGSFVQFTSGSTGSPKGVRLSLAALGVNASDIIQGCKHDNMRFVSWLPLTHDLGLVSSLATWTAFAPHLAGGGDMLLIPPERFMASPASWMRAVSEHGATVTAGPTFAYELAAKALHIAREPLDLSRLEVAIVGAESVRSSTLQSFGDAGERHGFRPTSFSPAYGLAEATVGVTMVAAGVPWKCRAPGDDDNDYMSCGPPLDHVEVRIDEPDDRGVGAVAVRSDALMEGYVSGSSAIEGGWLRTNDLGFVLDGELYVTGRADDVFFVAGRNVLSTDLEALLVERSLARPANCAVVPARDGGYVVVAAPRRRGQAVGEADLAREMRMVLARSVGVGPRAVLFVNGSWIPRTTSGKVQRRRVAEAVDGDDVPALSTFDFRRP